MFGNQLLQHLISYNSFRNMNMRLLEVAMFEKCRSSHFQSQRGVKCLRTGGKGLKILGLVGGVHYPITSHIGRKWVDFIWQPISIMGLLARVWTKFYLRKPVDYYTYFLRTFDGDSFSGICFNSFMKKVTIIQKSVHWFTKQINGLVSIC